jgi:hypothetical protein
MIHILTLPVLLALGGMTLLAQHAAPPFHPGEWEINSANTVMGGRTVSSQTQICAKQQMDFWKVAQVGLTCKPPKSHPVAGGIRVRVHCVYSQGPLHSEIRSEVIENFTDGGNSFTAAGTTTTDTVYQGVQPKRTSATLQTTAHRLGECH